MALTQVPGFMIAADSALPTGAGPIPYVGATAPAGWVLASGRTIGSATSGATERANADTQALFLLIWSSFADTEAAVSGGRGASAAADWAANKTIVVPDMRGRVAAGKDDMGGTAANRLTAGGSGLAGATMGKAGGAETHTLDTTQIPSHSHTLGAQSDGTAGSVTAAITGANGNRVSTNPSGNTGGGGAHNNTQPTIIFNAIIKL